MTERGFGARDARALGRQLAELQEKVRDLETASQAGLRSIEGGALDVYDDDDNLRGRVGLQSDGSVGVEEIGGPAPEIPTLPDVVPVSGGAVVMWDGTFEDAQPRRAIERIAVHVGQTPDFTIVTDDNEDDADTTELAAILARRGGSAFVALDPDQWWFVRLTAVSRAGVESPPTEAVAVYVAVPEATFYQDEFVLEAGGAQDLTLTFEPVDQSDHLYWNGLYQPQDVAWTRIGKVVSLTGQPTAARAGDVVNVEYAYLPDETTVGPWADPDAPDPRIVGDASWGWWMAGSDWEFVSYSDLNKRVTIRRTATGDAFVNQPGDSQGYRIKYHVAGQDFEGTWRDTVTETFFSAPSSEGYAWPISIYRTSDVWTDVGGEVGALVGRVFINAYPGWPEYHEAPPADFTDGF